MDGTIHNQRQHTPLDGSSNICPCSESRSLKGQREATKSAGIPKIIRKETQHPRRSLTTTDAGMGDGRTFHNKGIHPEIRAAAVQAAGALSTLRRRRRASLITMLRGMYSTNAAVSGATTIGGEAASDTYTRYRRAHTIKQGTWVCVHTPGDKGRLERASVWPALIKVR